jgi:putative ubiquitin-RnfH superfamily antitoxin RatB of RatAB toxin-antitoxin module
MQVSVAYAEPAQQFWTHVELQEGATIMDALQRSGVLERFPEIDLEQQKVGIFGKAGKLDAPVSEGDRVEIYRPITADPATVPRKDEEE